jgi:putative ABC transport system substrate-binding protein
MRRRALLLTAPLVAAFGAGRSAGQPAQARPIRIGFLSPGPAGGPSLAVFREALAQRGYIEGQTIEILPRFAGGDRARLGPLAEELVGLAPDILACSGAIAILALKRATERIPTVFAAVLSPETIVATGIVANAERPGGNITGVSSFDPDQAAKTVALLREILPRLGTVALLSDEDIPRPPPDVEMSPFERAYDVAARAAGLAPLMPRLKGPSPDLDAAFAQMTRGGAEALVVLEVPVPLQQLGPIAQRALTARLPSLFPGGYENTGNLINFGTSILDANRAMAELVDRIVRGADPGEIPLMRTARPELVVNQATAAKIGISVPEAVLRRADRIIGT